MSDERDLQFLEPMVEFMGEMHGADTEIVLYDVKTCRVRYVKNPFDADMVVGSEMRALEKTFLLERRYETEDYIVNYRALSRYKDKLKSATLFLKGRDGELLAILTVNQRVERLIELRNIIDSMISGVPQQTGKRQPSFYESFDVSVPDIVTKAISDELGAIGVPRNRLDASEKMRLIRSLDAKGIFLVKGAVGELAAALETTETTIYRYINRLSEEE